MRAVLFDLDGTLLPMDQDVFLKTYFQELAAKGAALGWEAGKLVQTILAGLEAMVNNDGSKTNEERFWEVFVAVFGPEIEKHTQEFERFYQHEFRRVKSAVRPTPLASQYVSLLKEKGYDLVLATNPVFPQVATWERLRWAGLDPQDFVLITTFENSRFTKPNLEYYGEILAALALQPGDCLLIGNDVEEDLCAALLGIEVFLVTDDLINPAEIDISRCLQGDRRVLLDFIKALPDRESQL